ARAASGFGIRDSGFGIRGSRFAVRGSRFSVFGSRFTTTVVVSGFLTDVALAESASRTVGAPLLSRAPALGSGFLSLAERDTITTAIAITAAAASGAMIQAARQFLRTVSPLSMRARTLVVHAPSGPHAVIFSGPSPF